MYNIVLIIVDAFSYWAWEKKCRNKNFNNSFLAKLTTQSIQYTNAYTSAPYTTTAHAGMFTGRYPYEHQLRQFFIKNRQLPQNFPTLAQRLARLGYKTTLYSDFLDIFEASGLTRGYNYLYNKDSLLTSHIKQLARSPQFITIHFFDLHAPYGLAHSDMYSPEHPYYQMMAKQKGLSRNNSLLLLRSQDPYEIWNSIFNPYSPNANTQTLKKMYLFGMNKFFTERFESIGKLISTKLPFSNTCYILTADHGEGRLFFKGNSSFGHGLNLTEEVLHVPLVIHHPNNTKMKRINQTVSTKDIYQLINNIASNNKNPWVFKSVLPIYAESWRYNRSTKLTSPPLHASESAKRLSADYILHQRYARSNDSSWLILENSPETNFPMLIHVSINIIRSGKEFKILPVLLILIIKSAFNTLKILIQDNRIRTNTLSEPITGLIHIKNENNRQPLKQNIIGSLLDTILKSSPLYQSITAKKYLLNHIRLKSIQ